MKLSCKLMMLLFAIFKQWDWNREMSWKERSDEMGIMQRMSIDNVLVTWFMLNKCLHNASFLSLLFLRTKARSSAARMLAVMLYIIPTFDVLKCTFESQKIIDKR
jgi:hypothetical protein